MIILRVKQIVLVSYILLGISSNAISQVLIEPSNRPVTIVGFIRETYGYGPPGYGEDKDVDTPIKYWTVELSKSININCIPEKQEWKDDCKSTKTIKLFFPVIPIGDKIKKSVIMMKNRRVSLLGTLHRADTVGEITPIYMDVAAIMLNTNINARRRRR